MTNPPKLLALHGQCCKCKEIVVSISAEQASNVDLVEKDASGGPEES
jgi:hypothetical protein